MKKPILTFLIGLAFPLLSPGQQPRSVAEVDPFIKEGETLSGSLAQTSTGPRRPEPRSDQDPFAPPGEVPKSVESEASEVNLFLELELISVTDSLLSELLTESKNGATDKDLRESLNEPLESNEAELIETAHILVGSGGFTGESIQEVIYPTEYDPASAFPLGSSSDEQMKGAPQSTSDSEPLIPRVENGVAYWPPAMVPHPAAFETRNTHLTWKGNVWDLSDEYAGVTLELELVSRTDDLVTDIQTSSGRQSTLRMPVFNRLSFDAEAIVTSEDQTFCFGSRQLRQSEEEGNEASRRSVMAFGRVRLLNEPDNQQELDQGGKEGGSVVSILEIIEVTEEQLIDLSITDTLRMDATPLRARADELINGGNARKIETLMMRFGVDMRNLASATGDEIVYATEYDPAELSDMMVPKHGGNPYRYWPAFLYPTPAEFTQRRTGLWMSAEPQIGDDQSNLLSVDSLNVEYISFHGMRTIQSIPTPTGVEPTVEMPYFTSNQLNIANLYCPDGGTLFLGSWTPFDDEGNPQTDLKWLVFYSAMVR